MGGKCCTDRKDEPASKGTSSAPTIAGAGAKTDRKSLAQGNAYDGDTRGRSIAHTLKGSPGDDAEKFDKAFEKGDLKAFVELLSSTQQIESFEERMHPWAADPKTVGALAGTQLAIMASVAEKDNPGVKHRIREAGGIEPLVGFLKSKEKDRIETAVVALSFLTAECPANTRKAYEAGAMEELMKHVGSPVAGMRAAAATTLRNICMENDTYRKKFVDLGGINGLVAQLDPKVDPALNHADVQLEAILNLQDIIEEEDDGQNEPRVIEAYARLAIAAGAMEKLTELLKVDDEEVSSSAREVLEVLQTVAAP